MALIVTTLAAALQLGDGTAAPEEPMLGVLTRLLAVGGAIVDQRTGAPDDLPEAIRDEAIVRVGAAAHKAYIDSIRFSPALSEMDRWGFDEVRGRVASLRKERSGSGSMLVNCLAISCCPRLCSTAGSRSTCGKTRCPPRA